MPKIAVIGTGYVGLVTGTCLADFGMDTVCVDMNEEKINNLKKGQVPIYEPGLTEMVLRNVQYKRLQFTTNMAEAVNNAEAIFIAVGTPPQEDGSADMKYVMAVAEQIATHMNEYKLVINKSTVPVGTGQKVKNAIAQKLSDLGKNIDFDVVSNPEFLREGSAIYDFTHPDKVVIGYETEKAKEIMKNVYRVLYLNETPFIYTNIESAEMIKYANNAFLAMKISFINEVANLCEKVGASVQQVANAIGKDGRIGSKFLHPGPGYGGSCFPKDTHALAHIGRENGSPMQLVEAAIRVNDNQKMKMVQKIEEAIVELEGKKLAILGLTFKPKTDDVRDAPSLTIIRELAKKGVTLNVYDPIGMHEAKASLADVESIRYCRDEYEAIEDCDGVIIVTEWHQFRSLDLERLKRSLKAPFFFDFRNIYDKQRMIQLGFNYFGVGV